MKEKIYCLKGEIWRPVVGFEGLYEVSNYGRVASLNWYGNSGKRGLLSPRHNKDNYLVVTLWKDGKKFYPTVHKLVAMAFPEICGTYSEGLEIDHINTVRDDNRAVNLRCCTRSENHLNPITRERMSEAKKGKKLSLSEETMKKLSEFRKGNTYAKGCHRSEETRKKMSENRNDKKPVLQFTKDGTFMADYESISEAERQTGIGISNISACCRGKSKSSGGFGWKYAENYLTG